MKLPFVGKQIAAKVAGKPDAESRSTPRQSTRASTKARGQAGEDAAVRLLEKQNFKIIARNWRPGNALRGEVDCIAWDEAARTRRVLCFIEVKARRDNQKGAPQEAVNAAKQRQLSRLANAFVSMHKIDDVPCRFDVVEVWLEANGTVARLALHRNAFDYCGGF
jgi:putative endonuclease